TLSFSTFFTTPSTISPISPYLSYILLFTTPHTFYFPNNSFLSLITSTSTLFIPPSLLNTSPKFHTFSSIPHYIPPLSIFPIFPLPTSFPYLIPYPFSIPSNPS
ncbi:hypothetical protein, partial [Dermacoccus nishinomiyaensis]|uniref:hypothetical protein n=1 Tax=Dermacoccus nishinomiyaensis TaxID=1274 RepID=UPI0016424BB3